MIDVAAVLRVLWLFVPAYVANMAPVLVQGHFERFATPIDGGRSFRGRRILGDHKTWRGLLAGIVAGGLVYELQRLLHTSGALPGLVLIDYVDHPLLPGLLMGLGAGVGDAVKSFFKRRVAIPPGASWPVFDQLDFFFGSYALLALVHAAPLIPALACLPVVLVGSVAVTTIGWALGWKEAWILRPRAGGAGAGRAVREARARAHRQDGDRRVPHDLLRDAADHEVRQAGEPEGPHDDRRRAARGLDDGVEGVGDHDSARDRRPGAPADRARDTGLEPPSLVRDEI